MKGTFLHNRTKHTVSRSLCLVSLLIIVSSCALFQSNEDKQRASLERLKEKFPTIGSTVNASGEIAKVTNIEATATYGTAILKITLRITNQTDLVMEKYSATLEDSASGEEYEISEADCLKSKLPAGQSTTCETTGVVSMFSSGGDPFFDSIFGASIMRDMLKNIEGTKLDFRLDSVSYSSEEFEGTIKY